MCARVRARVRARMHAHTSHPLRCILPHNHNHNHNRAHDPHVLLQALSHLGQACA